MPSLHGFKKWLNDQNATRNHTEKIHTLIVLVIGISFKKYVLRSNKNEIKPAQSGGVSDPPRSAYFISSYLAMSSQVKLLITNNAFCIVQRATAQSKTGIVVISV
jgi:hypothetical protein